jgi:GNAT superfamily N-acetyltransferase
MTFSLRLATLDDVPVLKALMDRSIRALLAPYLTPEGVEASFDIMGLDTQLIRDGTYVVVEEDGEIRGCGGWSKRATLFGGDHTGGREPALLDRSTEPARIRAMYTHPEFARRGIGRRILALCEDAARTAGFKRAALVATVAGEPLYRAAGYQLDRRIAVPTTRGTTVPCAEMSKAL